MRHLRSLTLSALLGSLLFMGTFALYAPTPLEVQYHHGCSTLSTYLACLAGGRQNSPGSQFLATERHRTFAGLTPDDLHEIVERRLDYLCDHPELCQS
jgi:hypothetical protein